MELFQKEQLDLVLGMKSAIISDKKTESALLYKGFLCAIVPIGHDLFNHEQLTIQELDGYTLYVQESSRIPLLISNVYHKIRSSCPNARIFYLSSIDEIEMMVRSGLGITVTPQYSLRPSESYKMIPLDIEGIRGRPEIDYYAVWQDKHKNNHAKDMIDILLKYYSQ